MSETAYAADAAAAAEKRWVAATSVAGAVLLTGTKLVVGLATRSLGLLSEAAHSALDLIAALVTFFAVRLADTPPDREHRYGHGKVENISALIETLLLLLTCAWIVREAVLRLCWRTVEVEATWWSFGVIVLSIVVDVSRSRALMRVAKKYDSQALEADALHFSTDIWSSVVVLIGLGLVKAGEVTGRAELFGRADALAALGVAVIVVVVSCQLGRRTLDALLDRAPDGTIAAAEAAARAVPGVVYCRRVRVRQSGANLFVDIIVGVRRDASLADGHRIAEAVEADIRAALGAADVMVHVDPA